MSKVNRKSVYILSAAALALVMGGTATAGSAYKTVTLEVDGQEQQISGFQFGTVDELLSKQGVQIGKEDLVQPAESSEIADGTKVVVKHAKEVVIQDGTQAAVKHYTHATNIADILKEMKIALNESDRVSQELTAGVQNGQTIAITRRGQDVQTAEERIPFQTERQPDAETYAGTEKVLTPGVEGKAVVTTTVVIENGKEVDRKTDRQVVQEAVNQVVAYGTKQRPVVVASRSGSGSGVATSNFTASQTMQMAASAYSMPGSRTATGTAAGPGTVAVDPSVIPLGTKLYIEGYGHAVATDVGGAIKGNRIDLHFDTQEQALQFGRRIVTVHIVSE